VKMLYNWIRIQYYFASVNTEYSIVVEVFVSLKLYISSINCCHFTKCTASAFVQKYSVGPSKANSRYLSLNKAIWL